MEIVAWLLKYGADLSTVNKARRRHPCDAVKRVVLTYRRRVDLQSGETALQSLSREYTRGDESQLNEAIHTGQLIVAVKSGDIANVRQLVECQGVDINAQDHVCWATCDILIQASHPSC